MLLKRHLLFAAVLWAGLLVTGLQAQESVNSSGGDATGSGGSAAYSIGQVVYTTHTGSTGSVAQGVQHAYEIFVVGVNETALDLSITLFPNPTAGLLTLQIDRFNNEKLSYQLYDLLGKRINNEAITARQTQINLNNLAAATYLVHVVSGDDKKVRSFKIVKTN